MTSSTLHYPLLSIPAYYIFSILPHAYASGILTSNGYKPNNANPKASLSPSAVKGKVPDDVFQKYQRAENAHSNNMEQMPMYAAAVIASIIAERATIRGQTGADTGLTSFVASWFAVRTLYNLAYIYISDHTTSFFRSAMWSVGLGLSTYQIYKAAQILGQ